MVLHGVIAKRFGFQMGQGWGSSNGEKSFGELWKRLGNYDPEAAAERRALSAAKWSAWWATTCLTNVPKAFNEVDVGSNSSVMMPSRESGKTPPK